MPTYISGAYAGQDVDTVQATLSAGGTPTYTGYDAPVYMEDRAIPPPTGELGGHETIYPGMTTNGQQESSLGSGVIQEGADLRDSITYLTGDQFVSGIVGEGVPEVTSGQQVQFAAVSALAMISRLPLIVRAAVTASLMAFQTVWRGTTVAWDALPGPVKIAMGAAGMAGLDIIFDLPGPGLRDILPGANGAGLPPGHMDIPGVHLGAHVIGSWVANGVMFYRLSDGKLAVQNKRGRWKVWRPKKPIVIMPTGAGDLRTLLRADTVLNKQAKRIAAMLNRRVGTRKKGTAAPKQEVVVIEGHGKASHLT